MDLDNIPPKLGLGTKTWDVIPLRGIDSDEFWAILNQVWK